MARISTGIRIGISAAVLAILAAVGGAAMAQEMIEPELTLSGHKTDVAGVAISPDGSRILTGGWDQDRTVRVYDAKSGALLHTLSGFDGAVPWAAFSPDGSRIVTASSDHKMRLWDAKTGALLSTQGSGWDDTSGHECGFTDVKFSPEGNSVAKATTCDVVTLYDVKTGNFLLKLSGHRSDVREVAFSPDGTRIVTASKDDTARVWDAKSGTSLLTLSGHSDDVWRAEFSPDGTRIVTGSWDKTARVWDAKTGATLLTLAGHGDSVSGVAFSPDSTHILTTTHSADWNVRVWDAQSGALLSTFAGSGAVFSPDGSRLAVSLCKSQVCDTRLLDFSTGKELAVFSGYSPYFTPDGNRLLTVNKDKAYVWNIQAATEHKQLADQRKAALAALSCDAVKALDSKLGGNEAAGCVLNKLLKSGTAREMYLAAVKYEADKDRAKAKQLYRVLLDRFPADDLAIKAGERITALGDVEAVENSNAEAKAAVEAQEQANREAIAQASREAEARREQDRADRCRGQDSCIASCSSLGGDYNSWSYCRGQCKSRFAGC